MSGRAAFMTSLAIGFVMLIASYLPAPILRNALLAIGTFTLFLLTYGYIMDEAERAEPKQHAAEWPHRTLLEWVFGSSFRANRWKALGLVLLIVTALAAPVLGLVVLLRGLGKP